MIRDSRARVVSTGKVSTTAGTGRAGLAAIGRFTAVPSSTVRRLS